MSNLPKNDHQPEKVTLPFDYENLTSLRVSQAGLSRLMEVSRQTVSTWVKEGKISTFPDGSIDPQKAVQEYLSNSSGGKVRAKMLRGASDKIDELVRINQELAEQLASNTLELEQLRPELETALAEKLEYESWLDNFFNLIFDGFSDLAIISQREPWEAQIDKLFDQAAPSPSPAEPPPADVDLDQFMDALPDIALPESLEDITDEI